MEIFLTYRGPWSKKGLEPLLKGRHGQHPARQVPKCVPRAISEVILIAKFTMKSHKTSRKYLLYHKTTLKYVYMGMYWPGDT